MWEDPIVENVRRIREQLSAQFDFELAAVFADLRARQTTVGDRLVRLPGADKETEPDTEADRKQSGELSTS